ncbi:hypothetical protein LCGC14_0790940 [marine sediment metagenome]|uniref:Methyltransferase type 11 domain-containing protein n=1 Tax=marine sediment metagenome TaxID=412755 RepID=A0A0F9QCC4_9ZZZZ
MKGGVAYGYQAEAETDQSSQGQSSETGCAAAQRAGEAVMGINTEIYDLMKPYLDTRPTLVLMGEQFMRRGMLKRFRGAHKIATRFIRAAHGCSVTSIDLNSNHGAVRYDLGKPMPDSWEGVFTMLYNGGTAEHVGSQWEFFRNCHVLMKNGSIMVHVVPLTGSWAGHSPWLYTRAFLPQLAQRNGYQVVDELFFSRGINEAMCMVFRHDGLLYNGIPYDQVKHA